MYKFIPLFADVCTLRLDFCTFTTAGPTGTTDGSTPNPDTTMDTFTITTTPTGSPIPLIAGENSGEHGNTNQSMNSLKLNWVINISKFAQEIQFAYSLMTV